MPKGAKKRAKLKKKQEESHPAGSNGGADNNNNNINGVNNSSCRDAASDGNHLPIPLNIPSDAVYMSEDSIESSEEMVTPRAEADEEEKKATASEVLVERTVQVLEQDGTGEVGEEAMIDSLSPEASEREQEGKVDARAKAHEPEVQDIVVSEVPEVLEPEVKSGDVVVRETAKVHPALESEHKGDETKSDGVVPQSEASGAHTTEVVRGPAVAMAAAAEHRATWWNCCGVFDALAGSEREMS